MEIKCENEKQLVLGELLDLRCKIKELSARLYAYYIQCQINEVFRGARPMLDIISDSNGVCYTLVNLDKQVEFNMYDYKTYVSNLNHIYGYRVKKDGTLGKRVEIISTYSTPYEIVGELGNK